MSTRQRYEIFRQLHKKGDPLVIPNAWDGGSARILESLGYEAIATSSAGYAFSLGYLDAPGAFTRKQIVGNASEIAQATSLPVSADLQNGFGNTPEDVATTIERAINAGLVGGSIEDASGDKHQPIYELSLAVEKVSAAVETARNSGFVVTARAENFLFDRPDLADTIRRLQAFAEAGADVVYAPGLPDLEAIREVCASVDVPVNVVMGLRGPVYSVSELAEAGVARISVGGSFARAALGGLLRAAEEVKEKGTFTYINEAMPGAQIAAVMVDSPSEKGN